MKVAPVRLLLFVMPSVGNALITEMLEKHDILIDVIVDVVVDGLSGNKQFPKYSNPPCFGVWDAALCLQLKEIRRTENHGQLSISIRGRLSMQHQNGDTRKFKQNKLCILETNFGR